jgi:hypothetical protein
MAAAFQTLPPRFFVTKGALPTFVSWSPSLSSSASFYCRLLEMFEVLDFIYIICFLVVCDV